jgi:Lrp/AsnC family leucine-responsive transcriptional regulator
MNLIKHLNSKRKPNFTEISENLKITRQTFQNRFRKLEERKIIKNFTININPNIKPNLRYVILEIKTNPKEPQIVQKLLKIPQLRMLDGIFGEFSLFALFIFKSSEEFNKVLSYIDEIMSNSYFKKYRIIETIKIFKTYGVNVDPEESISYELDELDFLILDILKMEQGLNLLSTYEITEILKERHEISVSQSTVYNRIKKMEKSNIILNYALDFDPEKVGFLGKFILRIKPQDPSNYGHLAFRLEKKKEISDLFRIGENFGLLAIVRMKKIKDYGRFIEKLYIEEKIEDTFTYFVLDQRKPYTNFLLY